MQVTRDPYTLRAAAGAVRIVLAVFAIVVFRPLLDAIKVVEMALFAYTAIASVFLVLIIFRIGDRRRAIAGGIIDMAMITLLVHALGSTTSTFTTIYVFAATLNTLVVGPRVGITMSVLAALAYGGLLLAENMGVVSLIPRVAGMHDPHAPMTALASWLLTALLLIATTSIVASLVTINELREAELREVNERLLALTNRDPLTDLWNRRYLFERIERAFAKNKAGRFALAVFDLDGFKSVNDRFGHLAGDALLRDLARAIAGGARDRDVVCRFGGDEFVVMLRDCDVAEARARMESIRAIVKAVAGAFREDCAVTVSVGLTMSRSSDDPASLIRRADDLAYTAKRAGGDRVHCDADDPETLR